MKTITFYEVFDNYSEDGLGQNCEKVVGRFFSQEKAFIFAANKGNYGSRANVREVTINIYQNVLEAELSEGFSSC